VAEVVDERGIVESTDAPRNFGLTWTIAWRSLWRNGRRTWLTISGIAFACLLVTFGMATQSGSYAGMIDTTTQFYTGQAQIVHPAYPAESKLEQTVPNVTSLLHQLHQIPALRASARAQAFALVSVGERSFGGMVVGVDFAAEREIVSFYDSLSKGSYPASSNEVMIGAVMARNLGASVGDEIVVLGAAKEGGMGALALMVSGEFESGQVELDRTLLFTHLSTLQGGFELADEAHAIILATHDTASMVALGSTVKAKLPSGVLYRDWQALLPDVVQGIEIDRISAAFMYGAILILVSFSVINTFVMIVFERTREFGMLLALGMRPAQIMLQVQAEALCMWFLGTVIGLALSTALIGWLAVEGIPIGDFQDMAGGFFLPERMYPAMTWESLVLAPVVLLAGTQLGAFFSTLRLRRLRPVTALRAE